MTGPEESDGDAAAGPVADDEVDLDIDIDTDPDRRVLVERLYAHLEATETLPVSTEAGRWLGEAQAVVADALGGAPEDVVARRVDQAVDLLSRVDDTGNPEVDDHVAAAELLARELQDRL